MLKTIKRFEFPTEGVTVTVPYQGRNVRVFKLPLYPPEEINTSSEEFNIIRNVINLKLAVDAGADLQIFEFNPPIELRVNYTRYDFEAGSGNLRLAFWDGKQWNLFEDDYYFLPDYPGQENLGGVAIAYISNWDDPHIAWVD